MGEPFLVFKKGSLEKRRGVVCEKENVDYTESGAHHPNSKNLSPIKGKRWGKMKMVKAFVRNWSSRYFVWHSRGVSYWKTEKHFLTDRRPSGVLAADEGLTISILDDDGVVGQTSGRPKTSFHFVFKTQARQVLVRAPNARVRAEWLAVLDKANALRNREIENSDAFNSRSFAAVELQAPSFRTGLVDFASDYSAIEPWDDEVSEGSIPSGAVGLGSQVASFDSEAPDLVFLGPDKASVSELVDTMLLSFSGGDQHAFQHLYFLVYVVLLSPAELLQELLGRFVGDKEIQNPEDMQGVPIESGQLLVLEAMSSWLQLFPRDFVGLVPELEAFFANVARGGSKTWGMGRRAPNLDIMVQQVGEIHDLFQEKVQEGLVKPPVLRRGASATFLRKFVHEVKDICDFDALEIAQELTGTDSHIFKLIHPRELLRKEWKRDTAAEKAPIVSKMIDTFNKRSYWIATQILSRRSIVERTAILKKFIRVLEELRSMNNFYGAYAVLNGLSMTPVFRLKSAWKLVPARLQQTFAVIKEQLDSKNNFRGYRNLYASLSHDLPKIPHLAVILQDLYQCEEISVFDKDSSNGNVVNWFKFQKLWRSVEQVIVSQQVLQWMEEHPSSPSIQLAIGATSNLGEEDLWKLSYLFEPRSARGAGNGSNKQR